MGELGEAMDKKELIKLQKKVINIVRKVSKESINTPMKKQLKAKADYVTNIDKKIEKKLITELREILPNSGFIAEEAKKNNLAEYNWIIDPIDGTTNLIFGFSYAISVALAYGESKNIILGVVYCPIEDVYYYAGKVLGSFKVKNKIATRLKTKKFKNGEGICLYGIPYNRAKTKKIFNILLKEIDDFSDIKRIGPASVDICRVAEGIAKKYIELDLKIWDVAAGTLILCEAGGNYIIDKDKYIFNSR